MQAEYMELFFMVTGLAALINGLLGVFLGVTYSGYKAIRGAQARFWGWVSLGMSAVLLGVWLFKDFTPA